MANLLLISHESDREQAAAVAERALLTQTRDADAPVLTHSTAEQLFDAPQLPKVDAVWIYAGRSLTRGTMFALQDLLAERALPILLSTADTELAAGQMWQDSVIAAADDQPREIGLMLNALLSGGRAASHVRQELDMLRRQHSGITGQMDRLDEELRLASRLQRQFLPASLPHLDDVAFEVLFRPAGYVSGDIYDVQCLDRHHNAFYLADAVGHGVPAALLTMFIKQSLQARDVYGHEPRILPPNEALSRLNRDMCERQHGPTQFATACYGLLDTRAGELQLARAGHPPPVLIRANGEVELLQPEGALLGVFEEATFAMDRISVQQGDRLLLYSDGFEFAFGNAGAHRMEDYAEELRRLCQGPIEQVVARLRARLDEQAGSLHQQDDLTVLLVDITPQPVDDDVEQFEARATPVTV